MGFIWFYISVENITRCHIVLFESDKINTDKNLSRVYLELESRLESTEFQPNVKGFDPNDVT